MMARNTSVAGSSGLVPVGTVALDVGVVGTTTGTGATIGEGGAVAAAGDAPALRVPAASRILFEVPNSMAMPSVTLLIVSSTILLSPLTSQEDSMTSTSPRPML